MAKAKNIRVVERTEGAPAGILPPAHPDPDAIDLRTRCAENGALIDQQIQKILEDQRALAQNVQMTDKRPERPEEQRQDINNAWTTLQPWQQQALWRDTRSYTMANAAGHNSRAEFLAKSAAQPHEPLPYADIPPGMELVEFLEIEYLDKGLLTPTFNRKALRAIDPALAALVDTRGQRQGLPPHVDIPKSNRKSNARERARPLRK